MPPVAGNYAGGITLSPNQVNPAGNPSQSAYINLPMSPQTTSTSNGSQVAGDALTQLANALRSGNLQDIQEKIREFNLTYANQVGELYGQNFGVGNPAPTTASTLGAGQATGSIGYIPGYTGLGSQQTQSALAQQASTAQGAAGLTGFYTAPAQSQYSPGTFLRIDPNTYDYGTHGDQLDYVLSSGQIQRVTLPQARAMGWDGDLSKLSTIPFSTAATLESAPPTKLPQQTLEGLTTYSNLNTAAENQALAEAGATGVYYRPGQVTPPGTNMQGGKFSDLPQATQMAYYYSRGGDWQAAMNSWVQDSNKSIQEYNVAHGLDPNANAVGAASGQGIQTLAAQQQYEQQQYQLAQLASQLQANPFQQAAVVGQANRILAGQPVAGFQAPKTVAGVGTAGGQNQGGMGYLQQIIDDIKDPTPNTQHINDFLDQTPTPNKIDSASFLRATPNTQNLVLQAMQTKYGIDPNDALAQIKRTLPQFTAPATLGAVRR